MTGGECHRPQRGKERKRGGEGVAFTHQQVYARETTRGVANSHTSFRKSVLHLELSPKAERACVSVCQTHLMLVGVFYF